MLRVFEDGRRNRHGRSAYYAQLCKALLDLQDAADKIFDRVSHAVGTEHQRLEGLSSRIRTAKAKVDAISGTKRAITVKSRSRYPSASSEIEDFCALFGGKIGGVRTDFPVATLLLNGGLSRESGEDGTLELFRFFSETSHENLSDDNNRKVGIGNMRCDVNSVADILLFNSTELPYHSYKTVDNLLGEPAIVEESSELKHAPLPPPPPSVLQGSMLSSTGSEDFGFRPTLRQVPSFSLPSTLPDLPMVAEISWSGSKPGVTRQSSIAPSAVSSVAPTNDETMLKSSSGYVRGQDEDSSLSLVSEHDSPSQKSCSSNEDAPNKSSDINKPVTRITSIHTMEENVKYKEISTLPMASIPLPPPPPPMTSLLTFDSSSKRQNSIMESGGPFAQVDETSDNLSLPQIGMCNKGSQSLCLHISSTIEDLFSKTDSRRAALLASIRDPGIVLRKTGLADYSKSKDSFIETMVNDGSFKASKNATIVPKPKSVNLLAEMAASLKMRRLSMQGAAHDKDQTTVKPSEQLTTSVATSPSTSSAKFTLPISNLHAYVAQRNEEVSEEEDWED